MFYRNVCPHPSSRNLLHSLGPLGLLNTQAKWPRSHFSNHSYPNSCSFPLFFPSIQFESLGVLCEAVKLLKFRSIFLVWNLKAIWWGKRSAHDYNDQHLLEIRGRPHFIPKVRPAWCGEDRREEWDGPAPGGSLSENGYMVILLCWPQIAPCVSVFHVPEDWLWHDLTGQNLP